MPRADFRKTEKKLRRDMEKVTARIQKLETRRASLPLTCLWPRQEKAKTRETVDRTQAPDQHLKNGRLPDRE